MKLSIEILLLKLVLLLKEKKQLLTKYRIYPFFNLRKLNIIIKYVEK